MKADGEKYISRITKGLHQYLKQESDLGIEVKELEELNSEVNHLIKYTPDQKLYGTPDHWASYQEISKTLAGDCEDYALLKYWALRKTGVPAEDMHILVFYDQVVRIHHAVLVVDGMILENRTDKLIPLERMTDILPNMAINEEEFFIYGKVRN